MINILPPFRLLSGACLKRFKITVGEPISRKLNDDLEFVDRCWNCNHGESIPGEKLQASFGEILHVFVVVASYDSRYTYEVNRAVNISRAIHCACLEC